jgi:hypothetical protein
MQKRSILKLIIGICLAFSCSTWAQSTPPNDFPAFLVPGHDQEITPLRALFWLHYAHARPLAPLWDEWLPNATLWPAHDASTATNRQSMRGRWASALAARTMTDDGYIATQQHDGPSHADGWPFPGWNIAGGVGWHFRGTGIPGYDVPTTTPPDYWTLVGGKRG